MKKTILGACVCASIAVASLAAGERSAQAADNNKGVITLREIEIVGRVQKPIASVDVSKIPPKLTLEELRQPFLDRIEEAIQHDPF